MGPRSQMQVNPYYQCNVMQETYTPNDATEEIAVQEEEEMKSHRIRTPLQMSISCIFRLMQFQGWSLLAHFKSRSLLVDKQALPLLIPAVQVHSLICLSQLKPLAISKNSAKIAVAGGGQLTSGAIIADTAFCFLVFQRSGGAEEFLVEKGRALANPSIPTLEKKKPILRHLLPSVHIII